HATAMTWGAVGFPIFGQTCLRSCRARSIAEIKQGQEVEFPSSCPAILNDCCYGCPVLAPLGRRCSFFRSPNLGACPRSHQTFFFLRVDFDGAVLLHPLAELVDKQIHYLAALLLEQCLPHLVLLFCIISG